jgi:hypothetical protein
MAPGGFTAKPSALQTQSEGAAGLQLYCEAVAVDVVESLAAMAGSAGHPGLASALNDAAGHGDKVFSGMVAAYGHASQSLAVTGQGYASADQRTAAAARGVPDPDLVFLNGIG